MDSVGIEKFGPWGNQDATTWSMQLGKHEIIKEVTIRYGFIVDGLQFQIEDQSNKRTTHTFGGTGGRAHKIILEAGEYITQLSGTDAEYMYANWSRCISSLKVHTNLNPSGYGPFGEQTKTRNTSHFSSPTTINGKICGFFGRADNYFHSIGLYVRKPTEIKKYGPWGNESPTNWEIKLEEDEAIKQVKIRSGFIVDSIGFTIADKTGNITRNFSVGTGGSNDKIIELKSNEYLTHLSGTQAVYQPRNSRLVSSLKVHTSLNPDGYGPFGEQQAVEHTSSFSTPIPNNGGMICGFFGRAEVFLESIGVYVEE